MSYSGQVPHILLADDERAITDYLVPILERAGFVVTVARDGDAALRGVSDRRPDLVVLDVLMPGLTGREVCRRLRAAGDWTPVIMLTQVSSTMDKVLSLEEDWIQGVPVLRQRLEGDSPHLGGHYVYALVKDGCDGQSTALRHAASLWAVIECVQKRPENRPPPDRTLCASGTRSWRARHVYQMVVGSDRCGDGVGRL